MSHLLAAIDVNVATPLVAAYLAQTQQTVVIRWLPLAITAASTPVQMIQAARLRRFDLSPRSLCVDLLNSLALLLDVWSWFNLPTPLILALNLSRELAPQQFAVHTASISLLIWCLHRTNVFAFSAAIAAWLLRWSASLLHRPDEPAFRLGWLAQTPLLYLATQSPLVLRAFPSNFPLATQHDKVLIGALAVAWALAQALVTPPRDDVSADYTSIPMTESGSKGGAPTSPPRRLPFAAIPYGAVMAALGLAQALDVLRLQGGWWGWIAATLALSMMLAHDRLPTTDHPLVLRVITLLLFTTSILHSLDVWPLAHRPSLIVVFAHYNESPHISRSTAARIKVASRRAGFGTPLVHVVHKGPDPLTKEEVEADELFVWENIGRDMGAYMRWIETFYDVLPEHVLFSQAEAMSENVFHDRLKLLNPSIGFLNLAWSARLLNGSESTNYMKVPEISQLYDIVWPEPHSGRFDPGPYPEHGEIYATYTGQFVVSRDRIRAHSKEKWAHVRAILESERESPIHIGGPPGWGYKGTPEGPDNPYFGHIVERAWALMFGCVDPSIDYRCSLKTAPTSECYCRDAR